MRNILRLFLSACLIFLMSAHAVPAQNTNAPLWEACQIAEPHDLPREYQWRWRAEQNLSCIIQKLDQAMASSGKNGPATLSHQQIQQLSDLAWGARDAAQRIGR